MIHATDNKYHTIMMSIEQRGDRIGGDLNYVII